MRDKVSRFTFQEIHLAFRATLVLLEARYRLKHSSVEEMRRWATMNGKRSCPREHLLRAFGRVSGRLKATCLVRALALQCFLSRHGYTSELRIGVGRSEKGFEAHAWLVDGEEVLEGGGQEAEEFTLLAAWPTERFH